MSFHCIRSTDDEDAVLNAHDDSKNQARIQRSRSSTDNLIIPRRTRYPSNTSPRPETEDLVVAERLLSHESEASAKPVEARGLHAHAARGIRNFNQIDGSQLSKSRGESSSEWSLFTLGRSSAGSVVTPDHDPFVYINMYNEVAQDLGLHRLASAIEHGELGKCQP